MIPITELKLVTVGARFDTRSIYIYESGSNSPIGRVEDDLLLLDDERRREEIAPLLRPLSVPFAAPTSEFHVEVPVEFQLAPNTIPNITLRCYPGHIAFRLADPDDDSEHLLLAEYNRSSQKLWVQDEAVAHGVCRYAARVGIPIKALGSPKTPWRMEEEIHYRDRHGAKEKRATNYRQVRQLVLREEARLYLPPVIVEKLATRWLRPGEAPFQFGETQKQFLSREKFVRQRRELFPEHSLRHSIVPCRLCGHNAAPFNLPYCSKDVAYCSECLDFAKRGAFARDRKQAMEAVKELARLEFAGAAPLPLQLKRVNTLGRSRFTPNAIDQMVLLRFFVQPGAWSWTKLLADAGLIDKGVRTKRGTWIPAEDGHLCRSLHEKAVDDFFHQHNIAHEPEPHYPYDPVLNANTRRRADWVLQDGTFVEMWGLHGNAEYDQKTEEKQALAKRYGIELVGLQRSDVKDLPNIFRTKMS